MQSDPVESSPQACHGWLKYLPRRPIFFEKSVQARDCNLCSLCRKDANMASWKEMEILIEIHTTVNIESGPVAGGR